MYDILQLNDMLLPELQDIAEQLSIPAMKKLDKQGLIYKILDSQAVAASASKDEPKKKGTRTRKPLTIKTSTSNGTEEAEIMESSVQEPEETNAPEIVTAKTVVAPNEASTGNRPVPRERAERAERPERTERADRPNRTDHTEKVERPERTERIQRDDKNATAEKADGQQRPPLQKEVPTLVSQELNKPKFHWMLQMHNLPQIRMQLRPQRFWPALDLIVSQAKTNLLLPQPKLPSHKDINLIAKNPSLISSSKA